MTSNNFIVNLTMYVIGKKCYEEKVVGGTVCRLKWSKRDVDRLEKSEGVCQTG